jgi:putative heme-binding domain-containing protein
MLRLIAASVLLLAASVASAADDIDTVASLLELLIDVDQATARDTLAKLSDSAQTGALTAEQTAQLKDRLGATLDGIIAKGDHPLADDAALLAAAWREPKAIELLRVKVLSNQNDEQRIAAFGALAVFAPQEALDAARRLLSDAKQPLALRSSVLASLGRIDQADVAKVVLAAYGQLEAELKPKAIELLTQRAAWSKALLEAISREELPPSVLNVNQVARLQASSDERVRELVAAKWGVVRAERNPQRERVVAEMKKFITTTPGNSRQGAAAFQKLCGQCHKIYGQGQDVGPDITANGRASFDQLLSNVFDPSLVIGAAYQARQVVTDEGRILTGLLAEESEQRIVLKLQGGKVEAVPRENVEELTVSPLSLMPEGIENQLKPEEIADLFAFLLLDRPPDDPQAKYLPGTPAALAQPAEAK